MFSESGPDLERKFLLLYNEIIEPYLKIYHDWVTVRLVCLYKLHITVHIGIAQDTNTPSLHYLTFQGDERRPCVSVIRRLSVLEGSSDRLQETAFMPDDGDHRKQKCLFVPPGSGMSTISRGQYQILPLSSPNTHSCVRSEGNSAQRQTTQTLQSCLLMTTSF